MDDETVLDRSITDESLRFELLTSFRAVHYPRVATQHKLDVEGAGSNSLRCNWHQVRPPGATVRLNASRWPGALCGDFR